jgi:hypothetical protein
MSPMPPLPRASLLNEVRTWPPFEAALVLLRPRQPLFLTLPASGRIPVRSCAAAIAIRVGAPAQSAPAFSPSAPPPRAPRRNLG